MKSPGRRNLKSTSLLGDGATRIRYILLLSLVGLFLFCGCNKTPPAENSASSAPPAAPTAAPAPEQSPAPAASAPAPAPDGPRPRASCRSSSPRLLHPHRHPRSTPCQVVQHLRSESPRISVQKPVTSATLLVERSRNLSESRE